MTGRLLPRAADRRPRSRGVAGGCVLVARFALVVVAALAVISNSPVAGASSPPVPAPELTAAEVPVADHVREAAAAVRAAPAAADRWGHYGHVLHAHGLFADALVAYDEAGRLDPRDARWPHLAGIVRSEDDTETALANFDAALAIDPGHAPTHIRRGLALRTLGRTDEATAAFARSLEIEPDYVSGLIHLGQARVAARDAAAALPLLERARAQRPNDARIVSALARAHALAGDRERARALAAEARGLEDGPEAEDPWLREVARERRTLQATIQRVDGLVDAGRIDLALAAGREAIRAGHDRGAIEVSLARAHYVARRPADAVASANRAIAAGRDGVPVRLIRAASLADLRQVDEARSAFAALIESDPEDPLVRRAAARFARSTNDHAAALDHLDAIAPKDRSSGDLRDRAESLRALDRPGEALAVLEPLLEGERNATTLLVLGETLRDLGRIDEAVTALDEADRTATVPRPGRRAAAIMMERGDWPEAIRRLRDLQGRFPAHPNVLNDLAWVLATCPLDAARDGREAERTIMPLVERTGRRQPAVLNTLAAAEAASGRFRDAVATMDEALRLLGPNGPVDTIRTYRERREAYAAGRAWIDPPRETTDGAPS